MKKSNNTRQIQYTSNIISPNQHHVSYCHAEDLSAAWQQARSFLSTIGKLQELLADDTIEISSREFYQTEIERLKGEIYSLVREIHSKKISCCPDTDKSGRSRMRWITRVADPSSKNGTRKITGATEKDLLQKLAAYYGLSDTYDAANPHPCSLATLYDSWIAYRTQTVELGTVKKDIANWKRYYLSDGTDILYKSIESVKPFEAREWIQKRVNDLNLTKRQYLDMVGIWSMIESYAYSYNRISRVMIKQLPSPTNFALPRRKVKEKDTLSPEEVRLFEPACRKMFEKKHNTAYLGLIIAPMIGVRVGELSCLSLTGNDSDNWYLIIHQQNTPQYTFTDGEVKETGYAVKDHLKKEKRLRRVPIGQEVRDIIDEAIEENRRNGIVSKYIFVDKSGNPKRPRCFERAMENVLFELSNGTRTHKNGKRVQPKNASTNIWTTKTNGIHTHRRSFVTNLIDAGVPDKSVQGYAGHSSIGTTQNNYHIAADIPDRMEGEVISAIYNIGGQNMALGDKNSGK